MPKLNFIIFCDKAFVSKEKHAEKANIIGVFDTINSLQFPAVHSSMSVFASVNVEDLLTGKHSETLRITKNNQEIGKTTETSFNKQPDKNKHEFIHTLSNVMFPSDGEYKIEILIDDNQVGHGNLFLNQIPRLNVTKSSQ